MHFPQAAGPGGEILGKGEDRASVDLAVAGDDAVGGNLHLFHAEIAATMDDKGIHFPEGPGIEEEIHPFAGGQFAFFLVLGHRFFTAHLQKLCFPIL